MSEAEEELFAVGIQLNESFTDPEVMSVTDALCDVAYSYDLSDVSGELGIEFDILVAGMFILSEKGFLTNSDRGQLSFRNFEVTTYAYPPTLALNHKYHPRVYILTAPEADEPTLNITILANGYTVKHSEIVQLER